MDREENLPRTNGQGKSEGTQLVPDLDTAVDFLKWLHPEVTWRTLTAINPDSGKITTRSYSDPADWQTFISAHNRDENIYYNLNRTKEPMNKKANKNDIALIFFLHADCDPNKGESPETAKARYLKTLEEKNLPRPSACVDSGNGLQFLWRLKTPLGPEHFARVEAINKGLASALCADIVTRNIDRILRLPGTINHPNTVKRNAGRETCKAKQIWCDDEH
jgi:Mesyanzhinovviridae DNA primase